MIKNVIFGSLVLLASCSGGNHESDAYGNLEANDVLISSQVAGQVLELMAQEGQLVKKADTLCVIDTLSLHLQKNQLVAQIDAVEVGLRKVYSAKEVQQAQLKQIVREVERIQSLFNEKAATQKQLDDVLSQKEIMERQIQNTQTQIPAIEAEKSVVVSKIESLNDQINKCIITSPMDATVLINIVELGETAAPGKNLFKLADLSNMYLRAYVSGDQLPHVAIGQVVTVFIDENKTTDKALQGTVSWISSEAEFTPKIIQTKKERVKQMYAMKIRVANTGAVKIGMPGEVSFNSTKE